MRRDPHQLHAAPMVASLKVMPSVECQTWPVSPTAQTSFAARTTPAFTASEKLLKGSVARTQLAPP